MDWLPPQTNPEEAIAAPAADAPAEAPKAPKAPKEKKEKPKKEAKAEGEGGSRAQHREGLAGAVPSQRASLGPGAITAFAQPPACVA